jgi:hypothetical protein
MSIAEINDMWFGMWSSWGLLGLRADALLLHINAILLLMCLLLQLLDIASTLYVLRLGGAEANPLAEWLMRLTSPLAGLVLCKLPLVLWLLFIYAGGQQQPLTASCVFVLIAYTLVVAHNLTTADQLKDRHHRTKDTP